MLAAIVESLRAGESIEVRGFGSFGIRHRAARIGRNPKTGAVVKVPAKRVWEETPIRDDLPPWTLAVIECYAGGNGRTL